MPEKRHYVSRSPREGDPEEYFYYEEDEISLRELIRTIINGKKIIAVITALVLVLTVLGSVIIPGLTITSKGEVSTAIQLYFTGIENGQTPDGRTYDPNEMKSTEVIQGALDRMLLSNQPSISQINQNITIEGVLPDGAAKTLKTISDLKDEELYIERLERLNFNPTVYILTLNVSNDLGLTLEEGRELLDGIALEYKDWLIQRYVGYEVLANVFAQDFSLDEYDYIQMADLINQQLATMDNYVRANVWDSSFTSQTTGLSRDDLLAVMESIRAVEIEMIYTKIAANYITKDAAKSVAIYERMAENKDRITSQRAEEGALLYTMIENFDNTSQTLIIGNESQTFDLSNQSRQYDSMVTRYIGAMNSSSNARADAAYYRVEAERFRNVEFVSGPESESAQEVQLIIEKALEKTVYWTQVVNETVKDYNRQESYQRYAEQIFPAAEYERGEGVNLPLNAAIGLVIGLMLGLFVVFFRAYMRPEEEVERHEK